MLRAVSFGPDATLRGSRWPVASAFRCVPPTSRTRIFTGGVPASAGLLELGALGGDHAHEFLPGRDERLRPFVLEPRCKGVHVDTGLRKASENLFAVTAVRGQDRADLAM